MKVVADSGILGLDFLQLAVSELVLLPGRDIDKASVLDADVLLVRSITRVDKSLLEGTAVKFVGTATSGRNHIDEPYLRDSGIAFVDSKGANASAVADYVFATLAHLSRLNGDNGASFQHITVGIIGVGCVGSLLNARLKAAGINTLCCDPPRALSERTDETRRFVTLEEVMACSIISVHVPYNDAADYPTQYLIGTRQLALLPEGAVLINACRGGVVDEEQLRSYAAVHKNFRYCSDVWRDEPCVPAEIVSVARLATPHVAGYSVQAKRAATSMLLNALQGYCSGMNLGHDAGKFRVAVESQAQILGTDSRKFYEFETAITSWEIIAEIFDLRSLDSAFREGARKGLTPASFDNLRKPLLQRQELGHCSVKVSKSITAFDRRLLDAVGIEVLRSDSYPTP